jgi:hypothetical protein
MVYNNMDSTPEPSIISTLANTTTKKQKKKKKKKTPTTVSMPQALEPEVIASNFRPPEVKSIALAIPLIPLSVRGDSVERGSCFSGDRNLDVTGKPRFPVHGLT